MDNQSPQKAGGSWPRPAPIDRNGTLMLIRTSLIALQQANDTNNYAVLYAMNAPGFQASNSTERLSQAFASLRNSRLDLSGVAVPELQLTVLPQVNEQGVMHMAGFFPSTPLQVNFDLQFTPIENHWRLLGIAVTVTPSTPVAPAAATSQPSAGKADTSRSPSVEVTTRPKPSATAKPRP